MITVGAVLDLQLPVAVIHVGRTAAQHFQAFRCLVDHLVDDDPGFAQVIAELRNGVAETAEQETPVVFEAGQALQIVGAVAVETVWIGAGLGVFHFEQLAGVAEGPAVKRAGE